MKLEELKNKISECLDHWNEDELNKLTDLFIQLSEERCKEQRVICVTEYCDAVKYIGDFHKEVAQDILNAPLPELR